MELKFLNAETAVFTNKLNIMEICKQFKNQITKPELVQAEWQKLQHYFDSSEREKLLKLSLLDF